jgi:hypothetical protein
MKKINVNVYATNCPGSSLGATVAGKMGSSLGATVAGKMDPATRAIRDSALRNLTGTDNVNSIARSKSRNTNIIKAQQVIKRANANIGLRVDSQAWKRNNASNYRYNTSAGKRLGGKRASSQLKSQIKTYLKK